MIIRLIVAMWAERLLYIRLDVLDPPDLPSAIMKRHLDPRSVPHGDSGNL